MPAIKVLIVDHYTLLREAIKAILNQEEDINVIAETFLADEAIDLVSEHKPDIVIISLLKPNISNSNLINQIRKVSPDTRFIAFIDVKSKEVEKALFDFKVSGLLRIDIEPDEVKTALRKVSKNDSYIDSRILDNLFTKNGKNGEFKLSARQLQILEMIAHGFTNKRISAELGISHDTVKTHVRVILRKLKAADRAQAVSKAYELGVLHHPNSLNPDLIGWY